MALKKQLPLEADKVNVKVDHEINLPISASPVHVTAQTDHVTVSTDHMTAHTDQATQIIFFNRRTQTLPEDPVRPLTLCPSTVNSTGSSADHLHSMINSSSSSAKSLGITVNSPGESARSLGSTIDSPCESAKFLGSTVNSPGELAKSLGSTFNSSGESAKSLGSAVYSPGESAKSLDSTVHYSGSSVVSLGSSVSTTIKSLGSTVKSLDSTVKSLDSTVNSPRSTVASLDNDHAHSPPRSNTESTASVNILLMDLGDPPFTDQSMQTLPSSLNTLFHDSANFNALYLTELHPYYAKIISGLGAVERNNSGNSLDTPSDVTRFTQTIITYPDESQPSLFNSASLPLPHSTGQIVTVGQAKQPEHFKPNRVNFTKNDNLVIVPNALSPTNSFMDASARGSSSGTQPFTLVSLSNSSSTTAFSTNNFTQTIATGLETNQSCTSTYSNLPSDDMSANHYLKSGISGQVLEIDRNLSSIKTGHVEFSMDEVQSFAVNVTSPSALKTFPLDQATQTTLNDMDNSQLLTIPKSQLDALFEEYIQLRSTISKDHLPLAAKTNQMDELFDDYIRLRSDASTHRNNFPLSSKNSQVDELYDDYIKLCTNVTQYQNDFPISAKSSEVDQLFSDYIKLCSKIRARKNNFPLSDKNSQMDELFADYIKLLADISANQNDFPLSVKNSQMDDLFADYIRLHADNSAHQNDFPLSVKNSQMDELFADYIKLRASISACQNDFPLSVKNSQMDELFADYIRLRASISAHQNDFPLSVKNSQIDELFADYIKLRADISAHQNKLHLQPPENQSVKMDAPTQSAAHSHLPDSSNLMLSSYRLPHGQPAPTASHQFKEHSLKSQTGKQQATQYDQAAKNGSIQTSRWQSLQAPGIQNGSNHTKRRQNLRTQEVDQAVENGSIHTTQQQSLQVLGTSKQTTFYSQQDPSISKHVNLENQPNQIQTSRRQSLKAPISNKQVMYHNQQAYNGSPENTQHRQQSQIASQETTQPGQLNQSPCKHTKKLNTHQAPSLAPTWQDSPKPFSNNSPKPNTISLSGSEKCTVSHFTQTPLPEDIYITMSDQHLHDDDSSTIFQDFGTQNDVLVLTPCRGREAGLASVPDQTTSMYSGFSYSLPNDTPEFPARKSPLKMAESSLLLEPESSSGNSWGFLIPKWPIGTESRRVNYERSNGSAVDSDAYINRPSSVLCYICGREYGTASINIHEKQCLKQWRKNNENRPPNLQWPEPVKPQVRLELTKDGAAGAESKQHKLDAINEAAAAALQAWFVPCEICGRTFFPDSLLVHARSCKPGSERKPKAVATKYPTKKT